MVTVAGIVEDTHRFDGKGKWAGSVDLRCPETGEDYRVVCTDDVLTKLEAGIDSGHEVKLESSAKRYDLYGYFPKGTVFKLFCDELPFSQIEQVPA